MKNRKSIIIRYCLFLRNLALRDLAKHLGMSVQYLHRKMNTGFFTDKQLQDCADFLDGEFVECIKNGSNKNEKSISFVFTDDVEFGGKVTLDENDEIKIVFNAKLGDLE